MKHVVKLDKKGRLVYDGLLSSKEIATIDEILSALKSELPQVEKDLEEEYGNGVLYKYYLGKVVSDLLNKYNINASERRTFWDEIKTLVTEKARTREDGKNSVTRSFYEQCYQLSLIDIDVVQKLSWRQWQDLLDRVGNREDERIFLWIKQINEKVREDDWREFEKGLHLYLKNKDTSVFSDEELFEIYDSILEMSKYWRIELVQFTKDNPKTVKTSGTSRSRRSKKYQATCLQLKRQYKEKLNESIFKEAFDIAMK